MTLKESAKASLGLIDKWLEFQVYKRELPGISVGVFVEDETIYTKSFGYKNLETPEKATPETLYRIASHSKLFTATAVMKLFADGKIRLDDRICDHLDWFHSEHDSNMTHVTVRQLLSHSSGMNRDGVTAHWQNDVFPDKDKIVEQAQSGLSSFEVSEHWKYSNMGYAILGQVIEAVTGKSYEEAVMELVVEPMGLENTRPDFDETTLPLHATGYGKRFPGKPPEAFEHAHANAMNSATGFSSNVPDLIRFYEHHLPGNESFLSDRDKREMQRVQFLEDEYSWGLGWSVHKLGKTNVVGHGGGYPGFLTTSMMNPKSKLIIVVLTNSLDGMPDELAKGINDLIHYAFNHKDDLVAEDVDDLGLCDQVAGFYGTRWGVSLYHRVDGKLVQISPEALAPAALASRYTYLGEQRFKMLHGGHNGNFGEEMAVVKDQATGSIRLVSGERVLEPFEMPN